MAKEALPLLRKIAEHKPPAANRGAPGLGGGGGEMMGGGGSPNYVAVAEAAINKIEAKPVDPASEQPELPGVPRR